MTDKISDLVITLIVAGLIFMAIFGTMYSQYVDLPDIENIISNESVNVTNGTSFITGNVGAGIKSGSYSLFNSSRSLTYTEDQNYTMNRTTGNVSIIQIYATSTSANGMGVIDYTWINIEGLTSTHSTLLGALVTVMIIGVAIMIYAYSRKSR